MSEEGKGWADNFRLIDKRKNDKEYIKIMHATRKSLVKVTLGYGDDFPKMMVIQASQGPP